MLDPADHTDGPCRGPPGVAVALGADVAAGETVPDGCQLLQQARVDRYGLDARIWPLRADLIVFTYNHMVVGLTGS